MTTKYHIVLADIHYPEHDANALKVVFEFIRKNKKRIASVTLLGDALDCANLSRHTKGKPSLRKHRGYKQDLDGFMQDILEPIERAVLPACKLTYICGNHEDWIESDLLDEMPELDGIVNIPDVLRLEERGWKWVPVGGHIERAGFVLLHGDQIGSGMHVAKKMVDSVNENCIMGHVHRFSAFSKAALVTEKKKQLGTTLPCLCTVAPAYAKNQPNAFVVGFGVLEEWAYNRANLYVPIVMDEKFSFGGVVYG
jgi:predicted phosphodiesterase